MKGVRMNDDRKAALSKVPAITLGFWIIKILATTLGETGGDTVTMTMNLGYLTGTFIFLSLLVVLVVLQIRPNSFTPCSTGRRSSPPPPRAPRWRTLRIVHSASATPADPR